jgi:hypothetical protein
MLKEQLLAISYQLTTNRERRTAIRERGTEIRGVFHMGLIHSVEFDRRLTT